MHPRRQLARRTVKRDGRATHGQRGRRVRVGRGDDHRIVSRFPGGPAAQQHFQILIAKAVGGVKFERRTGALILSRSLAVGDNELVFGQLFVAGIQIGFEKTDRARDVALVVIIYGPHVNDQRALGRVVVEGFEVG